MHVPDSVEGITHKLGEVIMQTKLAVVHPAILENFAKEEVRYPTMEKFRAVSFMRLLILQWIRSLKEVRRGAFAAYPDIDHRI